jgi:hypothetical protein
VSDAAGRIEIFGYAQEAFPPTDFHTASLIAHPIIVMGKLSNPPNRKERAQVLLLDTGSYVFDRVDTNGAGPPWLYKHTAELVDEGDAILISGGLIDDPNLPSVVENIDDWRLDTHTWRWDRLTDRAWPRFAFIRADARPNHLYWLRDLLWSRERPKRDHASDYRTERLSDLGPTPRLDLLEVLFVPGVAHMKLPEMEDEYRVHRVSVDGIIVRYVESDYDIRLTVEGNLPRETIDLLRADLLAKLEAIENARIDCVPLSTD